MTANLELLFDHLGHFGRFQAFVYFISVLQAVSCGIHYLASVFISVTPKYACNVSGNISTVLLPNSSSTSVMDDAWGLWTSFKDNLVVQLDNGEIWELQQCRRYRREETYNFSYEYEGNKTMFPCSDGFIYDHANVKSSIVTDWNLVCEREWLAKLVQPTFMLGVLVGAVIFGDIADRVGRRPVMWFTSTGQFLFGIAVAFTSDYYSFVVVRFLLAMMSSGYLVVVFVYVTEYVGIKARTWASMHVHAAFAVGIMVVALVGYLERTWWLYQIFISITTLPFVLCCWKLPETPFWLLSQGRNKEVQKIINTMQRWNKVSTPLRLSELYPIDQDNLQAKKTKESKILPIKKHNIFDLFSNWSITRTTISVWLIWFTGSLGYYVFSLGSVNLGGNEYFNLFLSGAVECPSYIVACIGMDLLGRRNTLAPFLLLSALICGLIMLIPQDYTILTIVASMCGKFAIGVAFGLIYLYTAELYPTIIRSLAVGSGSMMCRVGSVVAPFCVYLQDVWLFLPQLIVGLMALLTGALTLMLPETLGKPLTNTFEEAAELANSKNRKNAPQELNGLVLDSMVPLKQKENTAGP